jgi:hypothetical protein
LKGYLHFPETVYLILHTERYAWVIWIPTYAAEPQFDVKFRSSMLWLAFYVYFASIFKNTWIYLRLINISTSILFFRTFTCGLKRVSEDEIKINSTNKTTPITLAPRRHLPALILSPDSWLTGDFQLTVMKKILLCKPCDAPVAPTNLVRYSRAAEVLQIHYFTPLTLLLRVLVQPSDPPVSLAVLKSVPRGPSGDSHGTTCTIYLF